MLNNQDYMEIFHEIKNSVTLINSYLQLLEKKHPNIQDYDYWENTCTEVHRLRSIVTELSQMRNAFHFQPQILSVADFVQACSNDFRCFSAKEGIRYQLSHPADPLFIQADPRQLRHAFSNLLKNACEAMDHQGTIEIAISRDDTDALITITDFGDGISPELMDQIFQPFFSTKTEGSGLGLIITRQILETHKGSITVASTPGEGSTFTIRLPLKETP